jgi:hypothetical protein
MITTKRNKNPMNDISFVRGQIKKLQKLDSSSPAVEKKLVALYNAISEHEAIRASKTEWDNI